MDRNPAHRRLERRIAELAAVQDGVVALAQLLSLGLSRGAVESRLRRGRLFSVHRGVYAVGHPRLTTAGKRRAALLACGEGAVLSHRTAADIWELRPSNPRWSDVTIPSRAGRGRFDADAQHARGALPRLLPQSAPAPAAGERADRPLHGGLPMAEAAADRRDRRPRRAPHRRRVRARVGRDARLAVAGYRVVRYTERRLTREPAIVAPELRILLQIG